MAEPKTRKTKASVSAFLDEACDGERRKDCQKLVQIMKRATGAQPAMWGPAIVGFGSQHLKYASGRELDWPLVAFSPRKQNLTLYIVPGFEPYAALLAKLGKHTTSKSCLYVKRLADVDLDVLERLINASVKKTKKKAPVSA